MLCPCLPRHRHLFSQNDLCCFDYNEHKQAESTDYGQVVDRWYDDAECLTHSRDLNQDSIYLQGYFLKWELIPYEISNARHMRSFDHKVELMFPNIRVEESFPVFQKLFAVPTNFQTISFFYLEMKKNATFKKRYI